MKGARKKSKATTIRTRQVSWQTSVGVLLVQGGRGAAEEYHRQALSIKERTLGDEHLDVASTPTDPAGSLLRQGGR